MIAPGVRNRRGAVAGFGAFVLRMLVLPVGLLRGVLTALHPTRRRAGYGQLGSPKPQRSVHRQKQSEAMFQIARQRAEMRMLHIIGHGHDAPDPRDRFRSALRGVGVAYGVLPIGRLRALLRPPPHNAPAENVQRWREIAFMHESRHLFPVPAHTVTEVRRFGWALMVVLLMLLLGGYVGGFDVHLEMHTREYEHQEAILGHQEAILGQQEAVSWQGHAGEGEGGEVWSALGGHRALAVGEAVGAGFGAGEAVGAGFGAGGGASLGSGGAAAVADVPWGLAANGASGLGEADAAMGGAATGKGVEVAAGQGTFQSQAGLGKGAAGGEAGQAGAQGTVNQPGLWGEKKAVAPRDSRMLSTGGAGHGTEGGHATDSGGHGTDSGGHGTDSGGHGTDSGGHGTDSGGHGTDGGGGGHAHAHHDTARLDTQVVIIIVIGLILLTIFFEWLKDQAEQAVPREMSGVLEHIFGELTVLGFLAMVTYLAISGNVFARLSNLVYGDDQHLLHLFEQVHADLFYVMIAFALQAVWLIVTSFLQSARWQEFERFAIVHAKVTLTARGADAAPDAVHSPVHSLAARRSLQSQIDAAALEVLHCQGVVDEHGGYFYSWLRLLAAPLATARLSESRRQLRYTLLRHRFIRMQMLSPKFEMYAYLRRRVAAQVSHSIHMQPATWAVLVLLLVPCMELVYFASITGERYVPKDLFFYIVGLGLFIASLALRYHVQQIILEMTPEHPLLVPGNRLHLSPEEREEAGERAQAWSTSDGLPRTSPWGERNGVIHYWQLPRYERHDHWSRAACGLTAAGRRRSGWTRAEVLYDIATRFGGRRLHWLGEVLDFGRGGAEWLWGLQAYLLLFNAVYLVVVTDVGRAMGVESSWADAFSFMLISSLTMAASIETHAERSAVHAVEREMKLKSALRLLVFLFQLNTLLGAQETPFQLRLKSVLDASLDESRTASLPPTRPPHPPTAKPPPRATAPSFAASASTFSFFIESHSSRALAARVRIVRADPNRQAEWLELWDEIMASPSGRNPPAVDAYAIFGARLARALGGEDPWLRAEREYEAVRSRRGGAAGRRGGVEVPQMGVLTLTVFAWFVCRQRSIHMSFLLSPGEDPMVDVPLDPAAAPNEDEDFVATVLRVRNLFCDLRRMASRSRRAAAGSTGGGPEEEADPAARGAEDDWGISYECFTFFMAEMQVHLETHATELDLCEAVFDSIAIDRSAPPAPHRPLPRATQAPSSTLPSNATHPHPATSQSTSQHADTPHTAPPHTTHPHPAHPHSPHPPTPHPHTPHPHTDPTRDSLTLTRNELGAAFDACASFDAHVVDEFLYLFALDSDGHISKTSFLTVADQLDALRYDDGLLFQHTTSRLRHASNFASAGMAVAHGAHGHAH